MKLPTYKQLRGAPKKYTGEGLWNKFLEYVEDNKTDTMARVELLKAGDKAGEQKQCDLKVPLSIGGFVTFALITHKTFLNYMDEDQIDKELLQVSTHIHKIIETEQVNGANVGLYNANIVARLNGLNETVNVNNNEQGTVNINVAGLDLNLKK